MVVVSLSISESFEAYKYGDQTLGLINLVRLDRLLGKYLGVFF